MREHIVARTVHPELCGRHARRRGRELQPRPLGAGCPCTRRDAARAREVKPEARADASRAGLAAGKACTGIATRTEAGTGSRSGTDITCSACRDTGTCCTRQHAGTGERADADTLACHDTIDRDRSEPDAGACGTSHAARDDTPSHRTGCTGSHATRLDAEAGNDAGLRPEDHL